MGFITLQVLQALSVSSRSELWYALAAQVLLQYFRLAQSAKENLPGFTTTDPHLLHCIVSPALVIAIIFQNMTYTAKLNFKVVMQCVYMPILNATEFSHDIAPCIRYLVCFYPLRRSGLKTCLILGRKLELETTERSGRLGRKRTSLVVYLVFSKLILCFSKTLLTLFLPLLCSTFFC